MVISFDEYKRLEAREDEAWGRWATRAEKEGFLGLKVSEKLVEGLLNAQD